MANTLVFDIGKVLIRWDAEIPYRRLIPDDDARAAFFRDVLPPAWNLEQDRGRTWAAAEAEKIALFPQYADLIRAWRQNWHETVPGDIPENVAVLEGALAAGIPCYAITNFASDTFREAQARFPFLTRFAGIVVSAEERLIKPDPAIFEVFLTRYGMRAGDCLFMDDSAANIATARDLGFAIIHVTEGMDLAAAVRSFGFAI